MSLTRQKLTNVEETPIELEDREQLDRHRHRLTELDQLLMEAAKSGDRDLFGSIMGERLLLLSSYLKG